MRYFTPALLERANSLDDDVADAAQSAWERAIVRSRQRWQKIKSAFPKEVQRFERERLCLHDARVLGMGQQRDAFLFVLELEPPARVLVLMTFTLDSEPVIDTLALPDRQQAGPLYWLYEEFDLDRRKKCRFEVLLSNGWSVQLLFRNFRFQVVQKLLPDADGRARSPRRQAVPQSA